MHGSLLELYTTRDQHHQGQELITWLLEEARRFGVPGATMASAGLGFGQGGHLHSAHFFELADEPVYLRFIAEDDLVTRFMAHLESLQLHLFYVRIPAQFGRLGQVQDA